MELAVTRTERDGVVLLEVSGDLEMQTSHDLKATLDAALSTRPVAVDLSEVGFVDSTGLHVLGDWANSARELGVPVAFVAPPQRVVRLFEVTGLDQRIDLYGAVDAALDALGH